MIDAFRVGGSSLEAAGDEQDEGAGVERDPHGVDAVPAAAKAPPAGRIAGLLPAQDGEVDRHVAGEGEREHAAQATRGDAGERAGAVVESGGGEAEGERHLRRLDEPEAAVERLLGVDLLEVSEAGHGGMDDRPRRELHTRQGAGDDGARGQQEVAHALTSTISPMWTARSSSSRISFAMSARGTWARQLKRRAGPVR